MSKENLNALFQLYNRLINIEQQFILSTVGDNEVSQEVTDIIAQFDAATTRIAVRIQKLVDGQGKLSPEDKAAFQAEINALTLLGTDPNAPVE